MEKGKKIPPQEASQTNPVAKPEDTKGGINNKVSSGLIGTKLAEQAEENEEMPMHHLIADKDYPSGIREWMITSPSDLKYPTLVVAAAMLSVYLTRVRIQYVYDNQGEKSAIVLQVIVEGEQSSGKSFARYIMRTLMKPFIERDSEMRAKEQEYAALKRRQGKKDGTAARTEDRHHHPARNRIAHHVHQAMRCSRQTLWCSEDALRICR